jgi:hypothetical protein
MADDHKDWVCKKCSKNLWFKGCKSYSEEVDIHYRIAHRRD